MSRVLQQLHRDHANMAKLLDLLDAQVKLFDEDGGPDYDLVMDIMDYTSNYPDRCHHPMEDLVFRRLMKRDPGSRELVEELLRDHQALAQRTKQFAEVLARIVLDAEMPREQIAHLAREYVEVNRLHMRKEEERALPRAADVLREEDWSAVENAISGEDPLFGKQVQEQYLALHRAIVETSPATE